MNASNRRCFRMLITSLLAGLAMAGQWISTAAAEVKTVRCPAGGQAWSAKTDAHGTVHLLMNSPTGPLYTRSTDDGMSFTTPIAVLNSEVQKPGLEFIVWDMAVSSDGSVHVAMGTNAWKLKLPKEEWGFFYARLASGEERFTATRNINKKPSEGFSLAVSGSGDVTACWLADRLYANVSHDNGDTFGETIEIDAEVNPCNCCTTSCVYGADGRLAILYREETKNERDMYVLLWDQKQGDFSRTKVSQSVWNIETCPMTYYSIVADGDGYLAVWPTKGPIYFSRLSENGKPIPPREVRTPGNTGMRTGMLIQRSPNGSMLLAWSNDDAVGWQEYSQDGQTVGSPGSFASPGKGVAAVVNRKGDFLVFQ